MAKAKKKASKATKKAAKKTAKKAEAPARRAASRRAPVRLSPSERASLLKPGEELDELLTDVADAWRAVASKVKVAGLTPAKLDALSRAATKAAKKESDLAAKQAAKLAPLTDARMRAGDAAYREALKVKRIADAISATDPEVAEAFERVTERFKRGGAPPAPPPAEA